MTDEVAAMPQSLLREVVLRLIQPEKPRPIQASDPVHLKELQATACLKPPAAHRLVKSAEAIDFLVRFGAEAPLLDELAGLFLDVAETPPPLAHLLNPYIVPGFVFEEVLYAFRLVLLGASTETMERTMVQLVRGGWQRDAEQLAARLGRKLSKDEVMGLFKTYIYGAVYADHLDHEWTEFLERHLGVEGARTARREISERNARAADDIY